MKDLLVLFDESPMNEMIQVIFSFEQLPENLACAIRHTWSIVFRHLIHHTTFEHVHVDVDETGEDRRLDALEQL